MNLNKTTRLRILMVLFIIGLSSLILIRTFEVSDYWWHVKSGLYILENQTIPFQDVFSWYGKEMKLEWVSHEWLGAIILALFHQGFGAQLGGYLVNISCLWGIFFSLIYFNEKAFLKNIRFTFIWIALGIGLLAPLLNARPQLFSLLLLIWTIGILERFKHNENHRGIWCLPLLAILWSNLHGGSSNLIYLLPLFYLITHLKSFEWNRWKGTIFSKKQIKTLFIIIPFCFIGLVMNPHTTTIWSYPYTNMSDQFMLSIIQEWRAPDLKQWSDWLYFIQFILIAWFLFNTPKKINLNHFVLMILFIALNLRSIRFGFFLYIIATFYLLPYIPSLKKEKITEQYLYILAISGSLFFTFFLSQLPLLIQAPMQTLIPTETIQVLKDLNPQRLYNEYDFGSELIYHGIPVFVDGRADLYSSHNLKDVIQLTEGTGETETILKTYNFDVFLLYKQTPLTNFLSIHPNYELVYETDIINIFIKKRTHQ